MSKFRKKPVVIEAMQFDGTLDCACLIDGWSVGKAQVNYEVCERQAWFTGHMIVRTLKGSMLAGKGDWIIKGVKGEFYPCKPDIFAARYEPVEAA